MAINVEGPSFFLPRPETIAEKLRLSGVKITQVETFPQAIGHLWHLRLPSAILIDHDGTLRSVMDQMRRGRLGGVDRKWVDVLLDLDTVHDIYINSNRSKSGQKLTQTYGRLLDYPTFPHVWNETLGPERILGPQNYNFLNLGYKSSSEGVNNIAATLVESSLDKLEAGGVVVIGDRWAQDGQSAGGLKQVLSERLGSDIEVSLVKLPSPGYDTNLLGKVIP